MRNVERERVHDGRRARGRASRLRRVGSANNCKLAGRQR